MNRYFCLCGNEYFLKKTAVNHEIGFEDLALIEGFTRHKIFKKSLMVSISDFFLKFNGVFLKIIGAGLIYFTLLHHFKIEMTLFENILIGIGVGLFIKID